MGIIMGVQYYEGKERRYVGYLVVDVLQKMSRDGETTNRRSVLVSTDQEGLLQEILDGESSLR